LILDNFFQHSTVFLQSQQKSSKKLNAKCCNLLFHDNINHLSAVQLYFLKFKKQ